MQWTIGGMFRVSEGGGQLIRLHDREDHEFVSVFLTSADAHPPPHSPSSLIQRSLYSIHLSIHPLAFHTHIPITISSEDWVLLTVSVDVAEGVATCFVDGQLFEWNIDSASGAILRPDGNEEAALILGDADMTHALFDCTFLYSTHLTTDQLHDLAAESTSTLAERIAPVPRSGGFAIELMSNGSWGKYVEVPSNSLLSGFTQVGSHPIDELRTIPIHSYHHHSSILNQISTPCARSH